MSVLTVALFVTSISVFLILLAATIYLLLVQKQHSGTDSDVQAEGFVVAAPVFSCQLEVVVLDDCVQITNMDEKQVRLEGAGLGRGLRLVTEDQLQLTLQSGLNQYRLYSMNLQGHPSLQDEENEDAQFLLVRVAPEFVEIKPVFKYVRQRLEIIIWKLKPYAVRSESQLAERKVFSGYLQKTVHFSRSAGKYFRFQVTTNGPYSRMGSLSSQSNTMIAQMRRHRLLTLRVQPGRVIAVNQSSLLMQVVVKHRAESLKRRLSRDVAADLPLKGTFSFSLLPSGSNVENPRKALRLHLNEKQLFVEPHSKFGSLPLSCDVYLPDSEGDSPSQIVSGEFLSALQLPRASHHYVMCFFMHMKAPRSESLVLGAPAQYPNYSK